MNMNRKYERALRRDEDLYLMDVNEWRLAVSKCFFTPNDGRGYWVKDGNSSEDEIFETTQYDATHVIWYPK